MNTQINDTYIRTYVYVFKKKVGKKHKKLTNPN